MAGNGYPVAAGFPNQHGIMIPEIWSGKLLVKFYDATVFNEIANTEYEGEIKSQGDIVHIRTTPTITIRNHVKGQKLEYDTPTPTLVDLEINKGKTWGFIADDVDKQQADYAYVESWTNDASMQLKISVDTDILADIYDDCAAQNRGATAGRKTAGFNLGVATAPVAIDKTNILDFIVDCGTVLDEQSVPEENRWFVLPAWMCGMIKKSDLQDASLSGDGTSILRNGRIGRIDRFTLYMSNLIASGADTFGGSPVTAFETMFGHKSALTFASQLLKNEGPMRDKDVFGDFYRGLQVYGYKVIKPEAMGWGHVFKAG